jgi:hypothetical protein
MARGQCEERCGTAVQGGITRSGGQHVVGMQDTRDKGKKREQSEDMMSVANVNLQCFSKSTFLLRRKGCQKVIQESPISIFRSVAHTNQLHRTHQIMLMCWF